MPLIGGERGEAFRWRVRLSDRAPQKRFGLAVAAVGALAIGWFVFKSPLLGLVGFAIILGSTAEYWLGSQFSLNEKGATARTGFSLYSIDWADVKRILRGKEGIRLSPLESAGTMDAFRGVYLRYGDGNKEEIDEAVLGFGRFCPALVGGAVGGADGSADRQDRAGDLPAENADAGDPDAGDA